MKIHTLTAVVGSKACNASCDYCISKMSPSCGMDTSKPGNLHFRNFRIACRFAEKSGVTTCLLTGKGEPTLFPEMITSYANYASDYFPFIELQTNGIRIWKGELDEELDMWYKSGITTISISIAHHYPDRNAKIFGTEYNPWDVVRRLHDFGFTVRVNCTLVKGYIDSVDEIEKLISCARSNQVEQITVREVASYSGTSENQEVADYVTDHRVDGLCDKASAWFRSLEGVTKLLELPHGGCVYDYKGQNICLGNCMTETTDPNNIRQLIFFPDGKLRYSWSYEGAIIL